MMKLPGRFARPVAPPSLADLRQLRDHRRNNSFKAVLLMLGLAGMAVISALLVVATSYFSVVFVLVLMLCAALMYDFRVAVVALMVFIPLASTKFLPSFSGLNAQNLLLFGGLASYVLYRMSRKVDYRLIDKTLLWCYLVPFLLAGLVGAQHSHTLARLSLSAQDAITSRGGFILYYVIKPGLLIVFAWLIAAAVRRSAKPDGFISAFTVGALVPALFIAIYVPMSGVSLSQLVNFRSFLSVLGMHANQFAVVLNFGIATLLFAGLASPSSKRKVVMLGVAAFLAGTQVLTFSRGGYLGLALIAVAYMVVFRDPWKLLAALLVLSVAAFFVPDAVVDRVTLGITHGSHQDLSSGRVDELWLPLLPKVLESPVLGHGLMYVGRSDLVISGRMMKAAQAHNAYLDLLLDVGVIGTLLVLYFLGTVYRDFRYMAKNDPDPLMRGFFQGASVGMLAWLLQAFTDDRLFPNQPQMLFWMAYGLMLGRHPKMLRVAVDSLSRGRRPVPATPSP